MLQRTHIKTSFGHKTQLICFLCLMAWGGWAQKPTKIYLEHSNTLSFDKDISPDYQFLTGDVCFRHDSAFLYCDTAHYYSATNSLHAFGNVRMEQGDTLFIYGKDLFYDGNKKLAQIRKDVRMINKDMTLHTHYMDYDRVADLCYYRHGGKIVDSTNVLTSDYGRYNPGTKMAFFKNEVVLTHPQFVMKTDTLNYNTVTGVASIVSPTEITSENAFVQAYKGWYNTLNDNSMLLDRSYIISEQRYLTADTLFYQQLAGLGEAFHNIHIIDSARQISLKSQYAFSDQNQNYTLLTKEALMMEHSGADTLFLHADTLMTVKDSIYDTFRAYYHVRCYRINLQCVCDSIFYSTKDSVLDMNGAPIIWSDNQLVRGNHMKLYTKNQQADYLHVERNAITISQEDSVKRYFNQSSGNDLKAYFKGNTIHQVVIEGNPASVYLPRGDNDEIIGLNRLENGSIYLYMDSVGKMDRIKVAPQPKGKFYPLSLVTNEIQFLDNFSWPTELRPTGPKDVFRVTDEGESVFSQEEKKSSSSRSNRSNRNRNRK